VKLACAHCDRPFAVDENPVTVCSGDVMYLFCSRNCRDLYGFRELTQRICAREACSNRVPKGNRMLCLNCYQKGENFGEADTYFDETERARWERAERSLLKRITGQVRIFRAEDIAQEELRALVPSVQEEAE